MFKKVLVANRGEIAARIIRALGEMKIKSVAVYSDADAGLPYLKQADETYHLGASPARESYLNADKLLDVIRISGCDAVHPGYGFWSENYDFAERVEQAGAKFIGPSPQMILDLGHKTHARELFERHGMVFGNASGILRTRAEILDAIKRLGFPLLVKPATGGGGIGVYQLLKNFDEEKIFQVIELSRSVARRNFASDEIYFEKKIEKARHIEFQIIADRHGSANHLFERDCSTQRRYQKLIEETRAPAVPSDVISSQAEIVINTIKSIGYDNIGTFEMLMAPDFTFHFLEVNTRLQVEHAITEEITGVDIVRTQIALATGEKLADVIPQKIVSTGHAIEARVCAEDPETFFPSPGMLEIFRPPEGHVRIETGYAEGQEVTPYYDSLIAKVIVHEENRNRAIASLIQHLKHFEIRGLSSNIPALIKILESPQFQAGDVHTGLIDILF